MKKIFCSASQRYDFAADPMIMSDYRLKDSSVDFPTAFGDNHYNRSDVTSMSPMNRTAEKLALKIPALLRNRIRNYSESDLARPIGLSSNQVMTGFKMKEALWPADTKGDYHSSMKNAYFYEIKDWYEWTIEKCQ